MLGIINHAVIQLGAPDLQRGMTIDTRNILGNLELESLLKQAARH
jgi:hypothetical protein